MVLPTIASILWAWGRCSNTIQLVAHRHRALLVSYSMALSKTSLNAIRLCSALALLAAVLVATLVFHVQDHLGDLIQWIEDNRAVGSLSFVGLYALFTGN